MQRKFRQYSYRTAIYFIDLFCCWLRETRARSLVRVHISFEFVTYSAKSDCIRLGQRPMNRGKWSFSALIKVNKLHLYLFDVLFETSMTNSKLNKSIRMIPRFRILVFFAWIANSVHRLVREWIHLTQAFFGEKRNETILLKKSWTKNSRNFTFMLWSIYSNRWTTSQKRNCACVIYFLNHS